MFLVTLYIFKLHLTPNANPFDAKSIGKCYYIRNPSFGSSCQQDKMTRKPGKKQNENPVGCNGEGKR